jgi:DNA-binding PadR family transcriptional regulator
VARANKSRFVLLGLLESGPASGYELKKAVDETIAHFWNESFGQIYPALRALQAEGLVRAQRPRGPRQRVQYRITAAGRRELLQWLSRPAESAPPRNELLLKLVFSRSLPASARRAQVERYRRERDALAQRYAAMDASMAAAAAADVEWALGRVSLRFGLILNRAALAWCDETITELDRIEALEKGRVS